MSPTVIFINLFAISFLLVAFVKDKERAKKISCGSCKIVPSHSANCSYNHNYHRATFRICAAGEDFQICG
ncbi:MAG: hypothetical protein ACE5HR_02120 [bacterium]